MSLRKVLNLLYDMVTACISIADVTTDVLVAYRFYTTDKMAFFWVSVVIMFLAQIAYATAFILRFTGSSGISVGKRVCTFICILPLTPVMSFIFYWASQPNNCISKILSFFGLDSDESSAPDKNEPEITRWIKEKFEKHMGFILEAVIEAFPQSILQMIAIVYFNETELINVISILISLVSVATKSMVFSYAIEIKIFIFNWLSLVTDFFGIFMIISWVFYNPTNPGEFTWYGLMWLYKSIVINGLIILVLGSAACIAFMTSCWKYEISDSRKQNWNCFQSYCVASLLMLFTLCLWICGGALSLLLLEVACLCPIALFAFIINHERFTGSSKRGRLFVGIFDWILSSTSKRDEIIRICCVNRCMFVSSLHNNRLFQSYLLRNESACYKNVTLSELRYRVSPLYPSKAQIQAHFLSFFMQQPRNIYKEYKYYKNQAPGVRDNDKFTYYSIARIWITFVFFVLFPLHFISRLINLIYPLIVLSAINYNTNHIQLLQGIMTITWLFLFVLWIIFLILNLKIQYLTWHIAPGVSYFSTLHSVDIDKFNDKLIGYYDKIYLAPVREIYLNKLMGKDIAKIIISYLDIFDDE